MWWLIHLVSRLAMRALVHRLSVRNYCNKIRSSHPEVFFEKGVLKICSKSTGEHPCRSVISIKLLCNFIEIALRHGCSPVNLLHIFRTPFPRNTSGWLLLWDLAWNLQLRSCKDFTNIYRTFPLFWSMFWKYLIFSINSSLHIQSRTLSFIFLTFYVCELNFTTNN